MKTLRIALIVSFIVVIFLSSGLVSALDSNGASVFTLWSSQTLNAGDTVTVRLTFQSNTDEQIQIQQIGINFDWMASDTFYGHNLSDNPVTIQSNGSYTFDPFIIKIPSNASAGAHSYYVGVDGVEGIGDTSFSWNSPTSTIIVYSNTTGSTPTPSPSPGGGGQTQNPQSLLLYVAIIAIVVIVVVSIIVMMMRKKRKQANPVADQPLKTIDGQS